MHPTISFHLAQVHRADLRQRAQRRALARTARRNRRDQPRKAVAAWRRASGRRTRAVLG